MQKYDKINKYTYVQMLVMKNVTNNVPTGGDQSNPDTSEAKIRGEARNRQRRGRKKKRGGGTGIGRTGCQGKVPLSSHCAQDGPSLSTDQTNHVLTNILDLPPSSAIRFFILIRWSSLDTHSFRQGGSEDFQCLGMTVRAADRKYSRSPFFKEEIEPGSIDRSPDEGDVGISEPIRELWSKNTDSQKGRSIGQSHHMCNMVPWAVPQRQQQSDVEGYILCKRMG